MTQAYQVWHTFLLSKLDGIDFAGGHFETALHIFLANFKEGNLLMYNYLLMLSWQAHSFSDHPLSPDNLESFIDTNNLITS